MKWITLLLLLFSNAMASNDKSDNFYDFLQPLTVNLDNNKSLKNINREKSLAQFKSLAVNNPQSNEFYYLNYKLMQIFQYQHFQISLNGNSLHRTEEKSYNRDINIFIKILNSIQKPSFFTLYSKLYLETLESKRLTDQNLKRLYALSNKAQQPYVQLLSYVDSLNQLNSISLTDQENLHKQLTLLLIGLPKKQQTYILRLTALRLLPLYDKNSIEFEFNKLFAQKSNIKRDDILHILNYTDAEILKKYIMKKTRSFFEERIFKTTMKALRHNDIAMIFTILYIQKNDFNEARSYVRQTPRNNLYNQYNPFSTSIHLNNKYIYQRNSSLRKFAETMARLKDKIEEDNKDRLARVPPTNRDFYLYANGLYNKSYFGNFPMSSVFYHNEKIDKNFIPPTCNLNEAQKAYEEALRISKSDQFRAEIAYQLLKIEFHKAMLNTNNYTPTMQTMPKTTDRKEVIHLLKASKSFIEAIHDYKSDYSNTNYGQKVINKSILFTYL